MIKKKKEKVEKGILEEVETWLLKNIGKTGKVNITASPAVFVITKIK